MSSTDSSINRLLGDIRGEERAIDAARASHAAAQADLERYQRRLEEVRAIKRTLSGAMNDLATDVRSAQIDAQDRLGAATSGYAHTSALTDQYQADRESSTEGDGTCSQVHDALQSEIDRCQGEIEGACSRMRSAEASEASAQSRRSSYLQSARNLADEDDATVRVNVRTRY